MVLAGSALATGGLGLGLVLFQLGFGSAPLFFGFMSFIGLGNGLILPNATAGYLSVRPRLAGTASGLGGAIMIGGGAALSALAGLLLTPETGAFPLLWIMLVTSALGCASILFVIGRERSLADV